MIALLALLACAPAPEDPCAELQAELEACGFERDAYECAPGDGSDPALLGCAAAWIAADPACDKPGTLRAYTDVTGPAFAACSE